MIKLEGISKLYQVGEQIIHALDRVDAELHEGEILGLYGPSGSGKTTFLMMAGLVDLPSSGRILFKGKLVADSETDVSQLSSYRRRHIGFVFQRANLIPFLTAMENIQVAMTVNDVPDSESEDRACALLHALGMEGRMNSYPHQLSGGEQQRVAIARAIANRPVALFADEPTAALDSSRGREVVEMFGNLARRQGISVCVVTHDPRWIALFDKVIEMQDGRIIKQYRPGEKPAA